MFVEIHKFESADDLEPLCCLGPGKHTLGRGHALQCPDKRVSRNHVQIDISEASATIAAKHDINPCFFRPCESNSISLLKFNCPTELTDGDTFGFFPNQYWFSVRISTEDPTVGNDAVVPTDMCRGVKDRDVLPTVAAINCDREGNREVLPTAGGDIQAVLPTVDSGSLNTDQVLPTVAETIDQGSPTVNATTNGVLPTETDEMLPNLAEIPNEVLPTVAEITGEMLPSVSEITDAMLPTVVKTNGMLPTVGEITDDMLPTVGEITDERSPTVGEITSGMLPTVGEITNQMLPTVGDSNTSEALPTVGEANELPTVGDVTDQVMLTVDEAGLPIVKIKLEDCSDEEEASCETMTAVETEKPDSPVTVKAEKKVVRDRCWYGDKCFRRHPKHKSEFSHPGDADYDTDPKDTRPSCSYGDKCYRRNGQHRKDFKHPKGAHAKKLPRHHQPQQKRKLSDKSNSDDDDDPAKVDVGNITNQKRLRKRVAQQKQDTPEDDYDLDDPFIDDSDDEFQFESFDSDSDYDD